MNGLEISTMTFNQEKNKILNTTIVPSELLRALLLILSIEGRDTINYSLDADKNSSPSLSVFSSKFPLFRHLWP